MDLVYIQLSTLVIALATGVDTIGYCAASPYTCDCASSPRWNLLGPEVSGLIDPADFGNGLDLLVAGCVAVILFEGGLSI